jgi:hypothetical protein
MLLAWTVALAVFLCAVIAAVLLGIFAATRLTTGRTRLVLQILLAVIGLIVALLF